MHKLKSYLATLFLSTLGMVLGHELACHWDLIVRPASAESNSLSTHSFEMVDASGKKRILMATSAEGGPAIWFYDNNGKVRASMGLYEDNNMGIVLNDENEQAVQIFRTVGHESSPVLVMKAKGRDRIILGVNGPQSDPFFVTYDSNGNKKTLFGNY